MKTSHQRSTDLGAHRNRTPDVVAKAIKGEFKVLRLAPQYPGGPGHCVCCEFTVMAHFFDQQDAEEYAAWKNGK